MSYLPEGSDEQIDTPLLNENAGLWLAKRLPNKKILNITYNKALKEEVRRKVQTYHSCCQYSMGKVV